MKKKKIPSNYGISPNRNGEEKLKNIHIQQTRMENEVKKENRKEKSIKT